MSNYNQSEAKTDEVIANNLANNTGSNELVVDNSNPNLIGINEIKAYEIKANQIRAKAIDAALFIYSKYFKRLKPIMLIDAQAYLKYKFAINQLINIYPGIEKLFTNNNPSVEIYKQIDIDIFECLNDEKHLFFPNFMSHLSKLLYEKVKLYKDHPNCNNNVQKLYQYLQNTKDRCGNRIFEDMFEKLIGEPLIFEKKRGGIHDLEMYIQRTMERYDESMIKFLENLDLYIMYGLYISRTNKTIFFKVLSEYYLEYCKDKINVSRSEFMRRVSKEEGPICY